MAELARLLLALLMFLEEPSLLAMGNMGCLACGNGSVVSNLTMQ